MSEKVQVTKSFRLGDKRFYAGDVCEGDEADHALKYKHGNLIVPKKGAAPENKAAIASSVKAR